MSVRRISRREKKYVREVLNSEFRSSRATNMVTRAEKAFSGISNSAYSIAFTNGTATLHTALEALDIQPGDEVIVPPLTMSATCLAVLQANATPIFADVDLKTWQISPDAVADKINSRTKAVISVALYGGSPDYDNLQKAMAGLPLIEDNAEAVGTTYHGTVIGNFGNFSSYSFQSSKHLTAGEGGMLCTNSEELADKARRIQSLGYRGVTSRQGKISKTDIQNPNYLRHDILGWNYRMSDLTAAVVLGQVERSDNLLAIRRQSANMLLEAISGCSWLNAQEIYPYSTHSYWSFPVLLEMEGLAWNDFVSVFRNFGGKGVYAAWQLNYNEPVFLNSNFLGREKFISRQNLGDYSKGLCPNAEYLQPRILAFRTNEWDKKESTKQQLALKNTISYFEKSSNFRKGEF